MPTAGDYVHKGNYILKADANTNEVQQVFAAADLGACVIS